MRKAMAGQIYDALWRLGAAYDGGALSLACESEDGWQATFVLGRYAK